MRRTYLLLLLALVFMSFGYTTRTKEGNTVSKIYLIDNLLIRATPDQDIRFYDIANPATPAQVATIPIKGNHDVAATGHYMYADHDADLIIYDISNAAKPVALDTIRRVFNQYWGYYESGGTVINEGTTSGGLRSCNGCGNSEEVASPAPATRGTASNDASGTGGSLTRFAIVGDYLYCIDMSSMKVFDISEPTRPQFKNSVDVSWNIETIFPDGKHLFLGGRSGMFIYDISDQEIPTPLSEFTHASSCDPVVVEGNRAYVTLRGGTPCGGYNNQMDILDIGDLMNPKLIVSVPLTGPYGLAVRDGKAVVCDGSAGLKIIDVHSTDNVHQVGSISGITPYDVILRDNLLIVTAEDGYYLYDVNDITNPKPFGKLP